ncbi:MAG: PatB family C-S lyase [Venatoribacter sp.]
MPQFNFDIPISREHTHCEKYDGRLAKFGRADVIPLWVADMDFAAPPCVQEALAQRLAHPVFGYSFAPDSLYEALYAWFAQQHHWKIDPAQVMLTAGVVPSLFASVQALTEKGDGIIVPTPVYPPFFAAIEKTERTLLASPLLNTEHGYQLNFEELEQLAPKAKMLLLCSPHNPVGRVWTEDELNKIIDIALRHNLIIVSDDIHCDLVLRLAPSAKRQAHVAHTPLATLALPELRLITCISPSKTFNIPGLNLSALVTSHAQDKRAIQQVFSMLHVNPFNPLSMTAFEAAYKDGKSWLDALRDYLTANRDFVLSELQHTPIRAHAPEATALIWLDCRALNLNPDQLKHFFIHKAGLGLNDGPSFDPIHHGGDGFMRLNIGTQHTVLKYAMEQLKTALKIL